MRLPRCILLAEDDPKDVELIIRAFDKHNLANNIVTVKDGVEALDYLYRRERFANEPDINPVIILLDLKMPKIDGIQVLRKIKSDENLKAIPVVILTSSSETQDLKTCYELGVNAYVVKPVKFTEFVEAVKEIGVFWMLTNKPPPNSIKKKG